MRLSIIIPTFNEEGPLGRQLPWNRGEGDEIVVSDGGSRDSTLEVAEGAGARVVQGPTQRGKQLNLGAEAADGDLFLFLHADTRLPRGAGDHIREAIATGAVGGAFDLRFDTTHPVMNLASRLIGLRTRITRCPLGDQGLFVERKTFEALGGFREWPILEDLDFARRLQRRGPVHLIEAPIVTSARRYLGQGIARTILTNWLIFALYFAGVSPHRLARLYDHVR